MKKIIYLLLLLATLAPCLVSCHQMEEPEFEMPAPRFNENDSLLVIQALRTNILEMTADDAFSCIDSDTVRITKALKATYICPRPDAERFNKFRWILDTEANEYRLYSIIINQKYNDRICEALEILGNLERLEFLYLTISRWKGSIPAGISFF